MKIFSHPKLCSPRKLRARACRTQHYLAVPQRDRPRRASTTLQLLSERRARLQISSASSASSSSSVSSSATEGKLKFCSKMIAVVLTIIFLDALAFVTFCGMISLRKTCTLRTQKDARWALRVVYGCMVALGVLVVATNDDSPGAAGVAGILLGNAAALMIADFLVPRCFTQDTHSIGAAGLRANALRLEDVEAAVAP